MVRFGLQVLVFAWVVWLASLSVVQAEAPRPMRPLVWLGVKNFQRLEQRVTETAQLMKIPGMAQYRSARILPSIALLLDLWLQSGVYK
jgi:hypothetical protein